ncbi:MAG: TIGR00730 family Rossman fold protein [Ignavibacteriales bacterium]|nr:TIGR00730 family Rossman fold protein [Ignavibacteriales bacterium]
MKKIKQSVKAYDNPEFMNSTEARTLRILSEFIEPNTRFQKYKILDTIVFFGSARLMSKKDATAEYNKVKAMDPKKTAGFVEKLRHAQHMLDMSHYYEDTVELSRRLTEWSMSLNTDKNRFIVCTGGGPGIMEAANKGAHAAKGMSIGLNISIPYEQFVNKYVTEDLKFEFHYFFMRKFWFAYLAKALVVFPGGFGTMDELFEMLTLIQTGKIKKNLCIVVYDEKYWKTVMNFESLVDYGVINKSDLNLFQFCNTVDKAFEIVTKHFEKNYLKKK